MLYRENGQFKTSYESDQGIFPIKQDAWFVVGVLAFAAFIVPTLANEYFFQAILIPFLILSLAAIGVNILVGYCGQISLGSAAFMAVGAYGAYNFFVRLDGIPLVLALLLGGASAAVAGIVFGIPSLRVRGLYLAVATLAAQFLSDWIFLRVGWFTLNTPSGTAAVKDLSVFGWALNSAADKYWFCLMVLSVFALMAKNVTRGHTGREWMAVRDMDVAASVIGIRLMPAKLSAFAVSSFIIGVAGALWAFVYLGAWEPSAFSLDLSFKLLFMVIIGGMGTIIGSMFGAAFIVVLPIFLNQFLPWLGSSVGLHITTATVTHVEFMTFGALIVWFLIVEPHGLAKLWSIAKQKLRIWPFPH